MDDKPAEKPSEKIASTSDQRVANNVVRHEYRVLSEAEKEQMKTIKDLGLRFIEYCDAIRPLQGPPGDPRSAHAPGTGVPINTRELSLAKTKIEEAVMWGVKAITK